MKNQIRGYDYSGIIKQKEPANLKKLSYYQLAKARDSAKPKAQTIDVPEPLERRPKSAYATPAPNKTPKLIEQPQTSLQQPFTATLDSHKQIVNTDYLVKKHSDKCIGCAVCLSPQHRIISYKYPKQMKTKYGELFNISRPKNPEDKITFNYDKVRNQIHYQRLKEEDEQTVINARKIQFSHQTTNGDLQKISAAPGADEKSLKNAILENNREGNMVIVPVNCFLGNTSYTNQFIEIQNPQKMEAIRPANLNQGGHKFNGESYYKAEFASEYHQQEASGKVLRQKTLEQRYKTNTFGQQQRMGTLGGRNTARFQGQTSYQRNANQPVAFQKVTSLKPFDTLFVAPGLRILGKSQSRTTYDGQTVDICKYQRQKIKPKY